MLPFLWFAYILVPVRGWGLLDGRPLTLLSIAVLSLVCWLWFVRAAVGSPGLMFGALLAKFAVGSLLLLPRGFDARYYANSDFMLPIERPVDPSDRSFTRIDNRLKFGVPGAPDLPLFFLNDVGRFNFYLPSQPRRDTLPVSVIWEGVIRLAHREAARFYVRAPGGKAQLAVGRDFILQTTNGGLSRDGTLEAGYHRVVVSLSVPSDGARQIEAGQIVDGRERAFDSGTVYRRRAYAVAVAADIVVIWISRVFDGALCAWLLVASVGVLRDLYRRARHTYVARDALALVWVCAVADALIFAARAVGRMITLEGGQDWLTYESQARDIALNGIAMTQGAALGHGQPFYYQPLYPYFVAISHWLCGDGLYGVFFLQRLLVGAAVVAMWRVTVMLFGERVGAAGLTAAIVVLYVKLGAWSAVLLSETLFVPLLAVLVYLLVRLTVSRAETAMPRALGAGLVGGLATLARSTLVLGWFVVIPTMACAFRRARLPGRLVVGMSVTLVAVTSLATLRNAIVAHTFVPIASSGPVNLFLGNEPKTPVVIPVRHATAYASVGLDQFTQRVVEYAIQRPEAFADGLGRKALYTLGWFEALVPGDGYSSFYMLTWLSAVLGIVRMRTRTSTASMPSALTPLLLALTQFVSVVMIFPNVYGDRLILPFYLLLIPYCAVALDVLILSPVVAFSRATARSIS